MPSPHSTFTELVTTTLRNHPTEVADVVSGHNAFYRRLKDKGQIETFSGGYELVEPLDFNENGTYQRFSGYDTLSIAQSNVLTAAKFDTVQAAIHITASGEELRKNAGKEQLINLMKARVKNAMRTAANNMSVDIYSSGSLTNQMGGLAHLIQSNGQGTVGGIDSGTYTAWRNQFHEITSSNAWTKSNIKGYMNATWLTCVRGTDHPDLLLSTNDFYAAYWESLQDLARYNDPSGSSSKANAGFTSLKYMDADIVHDLNTSFTATGEKMYFLNTNFLKLKVHRQANWTQADEKVPVNQDAVMVPVIWMGQMTCNNRALQGIMLDAS
jgi:hypothetical protein